MLCLLLEDDKSSRSFVFPSFENSNFFLYKTNVIEIVLSCFLIFKIKETKDYVTSPRAWTCDFLPSSLSVSYVISLLPFSFFRCPFFGGFFFKKKAAEGRGQRHQEQDPPNRVHGFTNFLLGE